MTDSTTVSTANLEALTALPRNTQTTLSTLLRRVQQALTGTKDMDGDPVSLSEQDFALLYRIIVLLPGGTHATDPS